MVTLAHRIVLGLAGLVVATGALPQATAVYRYVEPSGRVVYSDRPPPPDAPPRKKTGPSATL